MKKSVTTIILLCVFLLPVKGYALEAIEVFSGYLKANIRDKNAYAGMPLFISFNFDAKPTFNTIGVNPKGDLHFIVEPFLNTIISPDNNVEIGSNFLIKYAYPLTKRLHPYVKGGLGVLFMTQHTREQSTQYNFLPQAGGGIHFFLKETIALSCEYRYRHLSNASFKSPNKGIDTNLILCGISFFY
ncbi:MAG: acyloxyacyl hydrolase [Candidatus Omnitrophota bacterium]|nr:MAG: acyloxyacyl hydrolase [Candidatus Omnitrophota bacterium]